VWSERRPEFLAGLKAYNRIPGSDQGITDRTMFLFGLVDDGRDGHLIVTQKRPDTHRNVMCFNIPRSPPTLEIAPFAIVAIIGKPKFGPYEMDKSIVSYDTTIVVV
jgi:hypothetical protein